MLDIEYMRQNYIFHVIMLIGCILVLLPEDKIKNPYMTQRVREVTGASCMLVGWYFYNNEKLF